MMLLRLLIVAHLFLFFAPVSAKNVVCYFLNWAQYRPGTCKHSVQNVNPSLCTHGVFAFSQLQGNKIVPFEYNDDTPAGQWRQFNDLKKSNPSLKTLLSVGGFLHGTSRFNLMARSQPSRAEFIASAVSLLRTWGFDGLDVDWEYPGNDSPDDINRFTDLMRETKEAFVKEAAATKKSPLLLTVAVAAGTWQASMSYNVTALNLYVDLVFIMSYDYHGSWTPSTGLNTPMSSTDGLDVHSTITWYSNNGLSASKIHMGAATYGRTWTLADPKQTYLGAPATGSGNAGNCTREKGILAYYEVCDLLRNKGYTERFDVLGQQKFAYSGNQWVTYDDRETMSIKMDYIDAHKLGGAMIWSLADDDFTGQFCGQGNYPLLRLVNGRMTSELTTSTTTTQKSSTAKLISNTTTAAKATAKALAAVPTTAPTTTIADPTTTTAAPTTTTADPTTTTAAPTTTTADPTTTTAAPTTTTAAQKTTAGAPTETITDPETTKADPTTTTADPTTTKETTADPTTTIVSTTTTTTKASTPTLTTKAPIKKTFKCPRSSGYFADPNSCTSYYNCRNYVAFQSQCPVNSLYNPSAARCEIKRTTQFVCTL